jgi:hypothetical protein
MWLLLAALAALPAAARAEGFFDLYFGVGFPQDSDIHTDADDPTVKNDINYLHEVDWDTTESLGLRGGYWFDQIEPSFIGIALDLSLYRAFEDSNFAELEVWNTPMTPLLMLRLPLGYSEEYPGGRVQPYIAVGPSFNLAFAHAEIDEIFPSNPNYFAYDDFDTTGFGVGFDGRAGLAVPIGHRFALFTEYRYTYVRPHFEEDVDVAAAPFGFDTEVEFEPVLKTHHVVFGASFRF